MSKLSVKVRSQILIPIKSVDSYDIEMLKEITTWNRYLDPYKCKQCDKSPEKPQYCNGCEFFEKHQFHKTEINKTTGKPYLVIRRGYLSVLKSMYQDDLVIKDLQTYVPMKEKRYQFDMSMLSEKQTAAVTTLVAALQKGESGYLKSPPRTGKTVMACAVILTLKLKTIIIAHQEDLLVGAGQLMTTFTQPTAKNAPINPGRYFTNLNKFLDKGKTPIKLCKTLKDFEETDICLVTYQMFLHPKGKAILEKIKDKFGLLVVDEFHRTGATGYSEIINKFTCPRLGLSATPKRKDKKHLICKSVFGEMLYQTSIESLSPIMSVVRTGFASNKNYKNWVYMLRFLESQEMRIEKLLQFAYRDVKKKKRSILIPVAHHSMVDSLVENLNDRGIKAIGWDGRLHKRDRPIPLQKSANREVDVIVAQRSMLTGINIPVWDMLYWIVPMNNDPNFEQEYKRICTPMPNKPTPVVRFFVDDYEVVQRCFFNCANVIHKLGGTFTDEALEYWISMGLRFRRLSGAKADRLRGVKPKSKSTSKKPVRPQPVNTLFDNEDLEIVEDEPKKESTRKTATKRKKTSHLSRTL